MYYYTNDNNNNNNNKDLDNVHLFDNSFEELPTQFLSNNQQPFDSNLINDSLFEMNNWDFYHSQQLDAQEAILLSDPNFVRQQQLLNQQKEIDTLRDTKKQQQQQQKRNRRLQQQDTIDHQRRFNELQARFRINYARKPSNHHQSSNASKSIPKKLSKPIMEERKKSDVLSSSLLVKNNHGDDVALSRTMPIQIHRVPRSNNLQHMDPESYQKQLDNQLDKVDFNDITVSELKEMLKQRGKPATGKKAVLLQRLQEERELIKSGSPSRFHRHSHPLPLSRHSYSEHQRPSSFHASNSSSSNNTQLDMPSSLPLGSPGSQLHRSIANMHIGSPRYSPYSSRLSSSPKSENNPYSTSVPSISSSPSNDLLLSSSYSSTKPISGRYSSKSYKPFTPSTLATPDKEDMDPFDTYYNHTDIPNKESQDGTTPTNGWADPSTDTTADLLNYSNEQIMELFMANNNNSF